jgi:hypothetical protein
VKAVRLNGTTVSLFPVAPQAHDARSVAKLLRRDPLPSDRPPPSRLYQIKPDIEVSLTACGLTVKCLENLRTRFKPIRDRILAHTDPSAPNVILSLGLAQRRQFYAEQVQVSQ